MDTPTMRLAIEELSIRGTIRVVDIQRACQVGYAEACRIIDALVTRGLVRRKDEDQMIRQWQAVPGAVSK